MPLLLLYSWLEIKRLHVLQAYSNVVKACLGVLLCRCAFASWWRSTVVERRSLTGELSLSCARPAADGRPLMWVNHPPQVSQLGQLILSSFLGR